MVHEKNLSVSLCVQELFHPQDFKWILATILVCLNTGFPIPVRDPLFFRLVILVGSCDNSSDVSEVNGSPRACLSTLSLDSIAGW